MTEQEVPRAGGAAPGCDARTRGPNRVVALTDRLEEANVQRLVGLTELAHLRNISLEALIRELGLAPTSQPLQSR